MVKKVIGLMSGTSLDGIDAALVNISQAENGLNIELVDFLNIDYKKEFRQKILKTTALDKSNIKDVAHLNIDLAEKFSEAVFSLLKKSNLTPADVDLVASHGQTIYHNVEDKEGISTLQVGSASFIAERTGITTVYNFRMRDLAAGGEGAPLVPYTDYLIYNSENKNRILQNIGGIANYSYLPANGELNDVVGSDNGPGNMIIDNAVETLTNGKMDFDKDGKMAGKGEASQKLLTEMMNHSFIKKTPPKSTGRADFGKRYTEKIVKKGKKMNLSKNDIITTITSFTALAIIDSYQKYLPTDIDEIIIGGGGSYNPYLLNKIKEYKNEKLRKDIKVLKQEDLGYSSEAKEAVAFAVLGYQTMKGKSNNVPGATGAQSEVILGEIVPGDDFYQFLNW
ncbi:MAG TPA: anhydro-N-acetylmuramic acid kinase [Halanaerobiales bacterium]|nr:anhydro-N-acetylmuramic acid kinase [Halanaerobiales bacterium]